MKHHLVTTLRQLLKNCLKISKDKSKDVEFDFNGIKVVVNHKVSSDVGYWLDEWSTATEERRKAYEQTPEYKERKREQEKELQLKQERCDNIMTILEHSGLKGGFALDAWMMEFIPLADHVGVTYNKEVVITTLESLGYVSGEFVGYEGEWDTCTTSRWIYGQILDGLKHHKCIHPILADKIRELKEK